MTATFFILTLLPFFTCGQNTAMDVSRSIMLSGDSETEEIIILVDQETILLKLNIQSAINKGKLSIEIVDPTGEKQGKFSIGSQIKTTKNNKENQKEEHVKGNINKIINEPIQGKWIIKLIPDKAEGAVNIQSTQSYKDN